MAKLNNTIVQGNLRVTGEAYASTVFENGTSLANKYYPLSGNPSGFLTGITSAMVTDALGYTPPSTDHTYNFAGTTFNSGNESNCEHNCNNAVDNGHYYYTSNGPATTLGASTSDGALYVQSFSSSWVGQIAQDYRNGRLFVRGKNNGTWQSWLNVLDSGNYNNFALPLTGGTLQASNSDTPLVIKNYSGTHGGYIAFTDANGTTRGYLSVNASQQPVICTNQDHRIALYEEIPGAASTSAAGLMPALASASVSSQTQNTKFLREDGSWAAPSYTSPHTQKYLHQITIAYTQKDIITFSFVNAESNKYTLARASNLIQDLYDAGFTTTTSPCPANGIISNASKTQLVSYVYVTIRTGSVLKFDVVNLIVTDSNNVTTIYTSAFSTSTVDITIVNNSLYYIWDVVTAL